MRVNTVMSDLNAMPLWWRMPETDCKALFASAVERLPARRIGRPEDIATAILFLAATPFAIGPTVRVSGGGVIG